MKTVVIVVMVTYYRLTHTVTIYYCVLYSQRRVVILYWEVFMFGQQPFAGLANEEVLGIVSEGKHFAPPTSLCSTAGSGLLN